MEIDTSKSFEDTLKQLADIAQAQKMDGPSFFMYALLQLCRKLDVELKKGKLIGI